MAKRRPTEKTQRQQKPSRQERRQAARSDAKARQTVATASPLTAATSYSRHDMLAFVALGLLVIVSYLPAMLWGGFVWDDSLCIKVDPVRDVSGLWQIWFSPSALEEEHHYWPLVYTTFWLEHKLWGFAPAGYHIVNVLLHLANTLLLWHLLRRLAVPGAWVVAAVFAVHPLHVESVAWIIERKDVLSGLFYLAAVLAWMRFVEKPNPRRYALPLVLYAAGLLSKSIVVTLPAALLVWHWWKQGRLASTDLWRLVPFFAVGLAITVGDLAFYWSETSAPLGYSFAERMLIASHALWFYAGKLLWPSELAVIYPRWDIHVADPLAWGYLVAAIVLAVALWHFRRQLGRGPLAGALFFAVTISPVLGFVDYTYMKYAFVADRHQYLAGIGVMAVVIGSAVYGVRRLSGLWQKGALGIAAVSLVVLGTLTWRQASIYRDDETFNRHIIALNPQARNVHRHLGIALYEQGRYEEALDSYRVAVAHRPNYAKVHSNLGMVLNKLERFEEAETHVRRAIALDPKTKIRYQRLGNALYGQGRYAEAADAFRVSAEHRPDYTQAHSGLGAALNELGRFEEAETHLRRAIELNPDHTEALYHLATLRFKQQRLDEAIEFLQHLIGIEPGHARALGDIGVALFYLGRSDEALQHFDRALSLDPTLEDVRANREAVLEAMEGNVE